MAREGQGVEVVGIAELDGARRHRDEVVERSAAAARAENATVEVEDASAEREIVGCEQRAFGKRRSPLVGVRAGEDQGPEAVLHDPAVADVTRERRIRLRRDFAVDVTEVELARERECPHRVGVVTDREVTEEDHRVGERVRSAVGRANRSSIKNKGSGAKRVVAPGKDHSRREGRSAGVAITTGERQHTVAQFRQPGPAAHSPRKRRLGVHREGPVFTGRAEVCRGGKEHCSVVLTVAERHVALDRDRIGKGAGRGSPASVRRDGR